jgi:hypothetical protein
VADADEVFVFAIQLIWAYPGCSVSCRETNVHIGSNHRNESLVEQALYFLLERGDIQVPWYQ